MESLTDRTTNAYDNFDRPVSTNQRGLTINYNYDANGNRTLVSTPSGETTYTYDGRNRIKTATTDDGTTEFTYAPDGKKQTVDYPNGSKIQYIYHPNNRIETIENTKPVVETEISKFSYEYDKNQERTE